MAHPPPRTLFATAAALLLLLLLLSTHPTNAQQQQQRQLITTMNPTSHQTFADSLTPLLYTNPNECSSALGVSMAFSLIYPGSTNDAVDEIRDTLGYPNDDDNKVLVWEETTERMLTAASGQCSSSGINSWTGECYSEAPLLKIANSIWFHNATALNQEYKAVVEELAIQTDFTSSNSPLEINEWVNNSTNGLISEIVDPNKALFPPDLLVAINSIYLKARWQEQFSEYFNNIDVFYSSAEREDPVGEAQYMHTVEYFEYSHDVIEGYQVVDLKFVESSMSMIFALPMLDDSTMNSEMVTSTELIAALENNQLESTRVALALPKFKFESEYKEVLMDAMQTLGIEAPFEEGEEGLCGIFEEEEFCDSLIITKIIQKTVIDVNEKGVEAAAVTAIGVGLTSAGPPPPDPILMVLDHPFQFFIYDKTEKLMLFEGRVGAPEVPEQEPTQDLLNEKHEDEEFWNKVFLVEPIVPQYTVAANSVATTTTSTAATTAVDPTSDATMITTSTSSTTAATSPQVTTTAAVTTTETTSTSSTSSTAMEGIVAPLPAMDPSKHQEFADDLTAIIYTNSNECSSALGVSMAFSIIYPGCMGDSSIEQVRQTLHYPEGTNMRLVWEATTQSMLSVYDGDGKKGSEVPLLQIANSIWFDKEETLNEDYEEVVGDYAMQTDFTDDESPDVVNEWVEESTNGLIDSIVPTGEPLFPPLVLIAINSIYLKARWQEQFLESKTNLDDFYDSPMRSTVVSQAHFMNMVEDFRYSDKVLPGYQVIDLPFASSQMSMVFVLPVNDASAGVAVPSTELISVLDGLETTRVALSLPKFKFESTYDSLADSLYDLGIVDAFTEGTGALCGLFEDTEDCEKLVVDTVIQKTVIDLNEKGVEAAAVTAVSVGVTSIGPPPADPILMLLDHPFQFFIYDKSQDLMLFEGRVGAPEVPEEEPAVALLDAKHSDPDFWLKEFFVNVMELAALSETTTVAATVSIEETTTVATTSQAISTVPQTDAATTVSATSAAVTSEATTVPQSTTATSTAATTLAVTSESSSTSEATTVPGSTAATSTTADAAITTNTSSTASSIPEPEQIVDSSGNRLGSFCTSIFLPFALAYVL